MSSEALAAAGHPEGEQHDVGGGHQREGAGDGRAQPEAAKDKRLRKEGRKEGSAGQVTGGEEAPLGSPVQNAPPHGQQGVVHGEGVAHAVAGLDAEGGDGQADEGAGHGGELHVAADAPPGGEDVEGDPRPGEAGVQLVHTLRAWRKEDEEEKHVDMQHRCTLFNVMEIIWK